MQPGNPPNDPYGQQPPQGQPDPYAAPPPYGQPTSGQPYPPPYGQPTSGQPYPAAPNYPAGGYAPQGPGGAPNNTLGLVSMILGIAAIPLVCCFYLGIPVGIAAVVLGFMGKKKAEQGLANNRGMAMAGLICGAVAIALGLLFIILAVVLNVWDIPSVT